MAAKTYSGKKPENMKKTVGYFLSYMGRHKRMLFVVAVLVSVSALCNLLGTYMIRQVVNGLADGNVSTLLKGVLTAAGIFATGALAAWGYSQTMVKASQQILFDIRRDLFSHIQTLPLKFFDTNGHGDIMSLFTNDIDTISDALIRFLCSAVLHLVLLRPAHLGFVNFLINRVVSQQFLMSSCAVHLSILQNHDLVCVHHRGNSLCNNNLGHILPLRQRCKESGSAGK